MSPVGAKTWKKRWARPSLFTNVPSASAKVPAGSPTSARSVGRRHQVVDHDDVRGAIRQRLDGLALAASIEIVFQDDDRVRVAAFDGIDGAIEAAPPSRASAEAVAFGHDESQAHRTSGRVQRPGDVRRRLDHAALPLPVPATTSGRCAARSAPAICSTSRCVVRTSVDRRRARWHRARAPRRSQAARDRRGAAKRVRRDIVEPRRSRAWR